MADSALSIWHSEGVTLAMCMHGGGRRPENEAKEMCLLRYCSTSTSMQLLQPGCCGFCSIRTAAELV